MSSDKILVLDFLIREEGDHYVIEAGTSYEGDEDFAWSGTFEGPLDDCIGATLEMWRHHQALRAIGDLVGLRTNLRCEFGKRDRPDFAQYFREVAQAFQAEAPGKAIAGKEWFGRLQ